MAVPHDGESCLQVDDRKGCDRCRGCRAWPALARPPSSLSVSAMNARGVTCGPVRVASVSEWRSTHPILQRGSDLGTADSVNAMPGFGGVEM
jgi:hypothetical protein